MYGVHCLIPFLNSGSELQFLISFGSRAEVFVPLNDIVPVVPLYTECTIEARKWLFIQCLYGLFGSGNIPLIKVGDKLLIILYISVANICKFFSWQVNELSFSKIS